MKHYRGTRQHRAKKSIPFVLTMVTGSPVAPGWGEPWLLSQDEVAHRLSISRTTLWRLLKERELEAVHIGSRTFVTSASIDAFIERHTSR